MSKINQTYNDMFIDASSITKALGGHVVNGVHGRSTASQAQTFHVPTLCTPQCHDPFLGEHVETQRINSLLVDDHKVLVTSRWTDFLLECDDLLHTLLNELPLGCQ